MAPLLTLTTSSRRSIAVECSCTLPCLDTILGWLLLCLMWGSASWWFYCPAEFALLRLFAKEQAERGGPSFAEGKPLVHAVYVAPLEALVAEKYAEWSEKLNKTLGIKIAKLTGAGVLTACASSR